MSESQAKRTSRQVTQENPDGTHEGVRMYDFGTDDPHGHSEHSVICVDLHNREANVIERIRHQGGRWGEYPLDPPNAVQWLRLYLTERQVETERELTQAVDRLARVIARRKGLGRRRLLRKSTKRRADR